VDYYLEPASLKPFSQLCELSAYASHLAYSEPMPPRVVYNQEMNTVSVDGEQVLLTELRAGVKNSIQSLRSRILDITSEDDIPNWTTGGTPVRDDPRDKTPRYSFLDDPRFSDAHLDLLKRLVQHSGWRIGLPDTTGRWMWNIPAILRFFSLTAGVQEVLMPLMQVASTAATRRGTEFSDTKIRNIPSRRRNICIQLGKVFNIAGYTKTSELTGHDSYLPAMLPEEISVPLVHYLAVVRPIECLLSRILWGEEVAALYASYLFIAQGQRLSSADDSVYLARFFKESCDADIRLNRWRQLAGSLTREFIDERFLTMNRRSDLGMGHSTATSRRNYGQDQDMAEFASSDAMFEQCWVDGEFHAILGLGSKPLPLAIRLRTAPTQVNISAATVEPFQDALRAAISSLRQSIAEDVIGSLREVIRAEISTFVERFPGGSAEVMIPNSEQEDTFHVATFPDSEPADTFPDTLPETFSKTFPEPFSDTFPETFTETDPDTLLETFLETSPDTFPDVVVMSPLTSAPKKRVNPGSKKSFNQSCESCNGEVVEERTHCKRRRLDIGPGHSATSTMSSSPLHSSVFRGQHQRDASGTPPTPRSSDFSEQQPLYGYRIISTKIPHSIPIPFPAAQAINRPSVSQCSTPAVARRLGPQVGDAILQGAMRNAWPEEQKRLKSAHLSKIMPVLENRCPLCFILHGRLETSLAVGEKLKSLSGHHPFRDCQLDTLLGEDLRVYPTFEGYLQFRKTLLLPGGFRYCWTCGMPQSTKYNGLEPACHANWSLGSPRGKLGSQGTRSGPSAPRKLCPWSDIIQVALYAIYFHRPSMEELRNHFPELHNYPPYLLPDGYEMALQLEQWARSLLIEHPSKGLYWMGLEVFLFKAAQYGLTA
jgi:hypothetical protein